MVNEDEQVTSFSIATIPLLLSFQNRIINQLQPDQYTIFKTMMTLFSRNSFMFMGSDFDYPVNYEYPYAPVDYYNLIGLYYNKQVKEQCV